MKLIVKKQSKRKINLENIYQIKFKTVITKK